MRNSILCICLLVGLSTSGCAVLNPYEENFGCPGGDFGKCQKVKQTYEDSFTNNKENFSPMVKNDKEGGASITLDPAYSDSFNQKYDYQKQLYAEMKGIIGQSETPMLTPARQMRLLVLDYVDNENVLFGYRYIYFLAERERWILPLNRIQIPENNHAENLFR